MADGHTGDRPGRLRSRRACLVVPGSNTHMLSKARGLEVDQVILDLEDSVAPAAKVEARQLVTGVLDSAWVAPTLSVRVNDAGSPWSLRDVEAVVAPPGGDAPDTIVLPKVTGPEQVNYVDHLLRHFEREADHAIGSIGLEIQVEEAKGLVRLPEILAVTERVEAVVLGPGDLAASLGMPAVTIGDTQPDYPGDSWHTVRVQVVLAARAAGVQAIDGPFAAVGDHDGHSRLKRMARAMGFDGSWVVHPGQVEAAHRIFGVGQEAFQAALALLDAYAKAVGEGETGAVLYGGAMIDEASRRLASAIVARGRAQGLRPASTSREGA
jgi:citrate lyase subunit beta / citryl-CoA lyase